MSLKRCNTTSASILLVIVALICNSCSDTSNQKVTLPPDQEEFLQKLVNERVLMLEPEINRAYIDPFLWRGMDAKQKENFSFVLAVYCGNKKGTHIYRVEVYDKKSAKKLAKYSPTGGFEVY